LTKLHN